MVWLWCGCDAVVEMAPKRHRMIHSNEYYAAIGQLDNLSSTKSGACVLSVCLTLEQ